MKHYCALCGRPLLHPAVFIGSLPVGPVCARRAGLVQLAKRRTGMLKLAVATTTARQAWPQTLDLFAELTA